MNCNEVSQTCRDLVQQFCGSLVFYGNSVDFERAKLGYVNQLKGILYVVRLDRNYPRIVQRYLDELQSIQFMAPAARSASADSLTGKGAAQ